MRNLPAGLEDDNLELYRTQKFKAAAVTGGQRFEYLELPLIMREPFQAELIQDKKTHDFIKHEWKIFDADKTEEAFVSCRYGGLNSSPDLCKGKITPDAPCCNDILTCNGLGIVCLIPETKNGKLSKQEYRVVFLVAQGHLDKEIANILNIEIPTIRTYLNRIREKLCVNNRIEIAQWARNNEIV